jgi:hypothetical protein
MQLALFLQTQHLSRPGVALSLPFQLGISFAAYLEQLETTEVAHLASDAVTALFQTKGVLSSSEHFERRGDTSYIDVSTWQASHIPELQALSRMYLQRLSYFNLHLLLDGIKCELYVRCTAPKGDAYVAPGSNFHPEILLYLDLDLSPAHHAFLEDHADYVETVALVLLLRLVAY